MYFKLALFTPSINHPLHPPTLSHPTLTFLLLPFPVEFSLCDPVNLESGACCGMWSIYLCVCVGGGHIIKENQLFPLPAAIQCLQFLSWQRDFMPTFPASVLVILSGWSLARTFNPQH